MVTFLKNAALVIIGLGSGVVISGAVFALITAIGVVTRLAQKTGTERYVKVYEESIVLGGILASILGFLQPYLPIGKVAAAVLSLLVGMFYGCFAVSLAEVLDVFPIMTRRIRIQRGMFWFVLALAFGKMFGSILYFFVPGYYYF